jgi:predicted RND superfamily exporter protein
MMIILFRSFAVGLTAMIPILFPIVVSMGIMGLVGIELSIASSMAFAVAIGLTVDNTIHLIWNFHKSIRQGLNRMEASARALHHTGISTLTSSLVLAGGFMSFNFSSVWPVTHFGWLVTLCIVMAAVSTLLLTPVIFCTFNVIKPKV